ncbi:carbonic anhydrase-like [Xiphophorus maculatus]|uniref:Carbonic anhydrase n=1 Tax=Xiphophorus maculatus TaxID=8083 RepID=A0A3B5PW50_XIPMA|nr:carbonic anhydrase-like [Xiphophorus maculatus]XP_023196310.1 carbonic anhydrase-like [Xiphophorus maculatus]
MCLLKLVLGLTLVALVKSNEWCYTGCGHTPEHWEALPGSHCGGEKQSPIDIVSSIVTIDPNLDNFIFVNFSSQSAIKNITNNGHSVQCDIEANEVEVSGGGLDGDYSVLQFHFHWDVANHSGSEHALDGHHYPMEMHIVTAKKGVLPNETLNHEDGLAVLGFFIDATEDGNLSWPWETFTSYLKDITEEGSSVKVDNITIDDLIGDVDLTKFYRYMGSLTTPYCHEAVVWTLFHEPIKVHKDLLLHFSTENSIAPNYRPTQPLNGRIITASPAAPPAHLWCYEDHCDYTPSHWSNLPGSYCGGESQSPIDISTDSVVENENLSSFTFTNFDNKHAIKSITNTGHTVQCVLEDGLVEVSGGGLNHVYSTLQFHFHWGTESADSEGSEHSVDKKRYPMEMHIVSKRKNLTLEEALNTPDGLAVLGFLIEAPQSPRSMSSSVPAETPSPTPSSASDMEAWKTLTSYLSDIKDIESEVEVTDEISIDDLLGNVNRDSFFRYSGSLTTPSCNEAVVWTVFKESVKVDQDLMALFPENAGYHNVFRPGQSLHSRKVYTTAAAPGPGPVAGPGPGPSPGPVWVYLLLPCLCALYC